MADYRQIHTHIWKDDWFLDLSPQEKLLFIYLFSNSSTNLVGMYKIALRIIEFETGLPLDFIRTALDKFTADNKVIYEDGYVLVVNMQKYNANSSPKVAARIRYELSEIPDIPLKIQYFQTNIPYRYRIDTLSPLTLTLTESLTEQDSTEQGAAAASSSFPSESNLLQYFTMVTGMMTFPAGSYSSDLNRLAAIYSTHRGATVEYLKPFWDEWCKRGYSRSNTAWLDWAVAGHIPERKTQPNNGVKPGVEDTLARLKRREDANAH